MKDGWVRLWRRILKSRLWCWCSSKQITVAECCVIKAAWEDTVVQGIPVRRGQWLTHYEEIANLCPKDVTYRVARQAVETLSKRKIEFLGREHVSYHGRHFVLLTVINYDTYNPTSTPIGSDHGSDHGTLSAGGRQAVGTAIKEEVKEDQELKEPRIPPVAFQEAWNSHPSLPHIRIMTKDRKARLNRRAAYKDFRDNWQEAITALSQSPWHTGQNDRGWKADVDWFLKNDTNWAKALERKDTVEIRTRKSREEIERIEAARLKEAEEKYGEVDPDKLPGFLRDKFKETIEAADVSWVKGDKRERDNR